MLLFIASCVETEVPANVGGSAVFPTLPGIDVRVTKTPKWLTKTQQSVSGRELRASFRSSPIYTFGLSYEFLREAAAFSEIQTLVGFFNDRKGSFESFKFTDPSDNAVTNQQIGTGDELTTAFQLVRGYGNNIEPVMNLNGTPAIFVDGLQKQEGVDYSLSQLGVVTFISAPSYGASISWSGSYYYRCRFVDDAATFESFLYQLWTLKKLDFVGSLGSKI